jgi:type I site-specific restriction-modification system R (restriction) subunit
LEHRVLILIQLSAKVLTLWFTPIVGALLVLLKISEAVDDRATLDIVYIGKTSKDNIKSKQAFDQAFEDVFRNRTKEEKLEIQQRYGTMQAYLENMDRLRKIADNLWLRLNGAGMDL